MGPVTRTLIALNVATFVAQALVGDAMIVRFALWPIGASRSIAGLDGVAHFEVWQLVTSSLLHANLNHLLLNMFALYMFGRDVESALGASRYLRLYLAAVVSSALLQLAVVSWPTGGPALPTLGASGGVFGVLLAFGMLFPRRTVTLLFPPIPMPAWLFVIGYGLLELVNGVTGTRAGVAHFAHLGGMLGALVLLLRWRRHAAMPGALPEPEAH
jgi:membrane associated rhomboid family serine protease